MIAQGLRADAKRAADLSSKFAAIRNIGRELQALFGIPYAPRGFKDVGQYQADAVGLFADLNDRANKLDSMAQVLDEMLANAD